MALIDFIRLSDIISRMILWIYILLCIIWGSTWMGIKIGLEDAPPFISLSIRYILSIAILYSIILLKRYKFPADNKDLFKLAYPGLYTYGGSYILVYFGELYISSSLTSVLFVSFPLFVAILSIFIIKTEKLNKIVWLGLILGFIGIAIVFYDSLQFSGNLFLGCSLVLLSSLFAGYGMIIHKKDFTNENIYIATALQMSLGLVPMILGALIFENFDDFEFTYKSIGSIIYLSVFGSVIAFLCYYWLLRHITAVMASLVTFITPIVALFIGVGLFGETLPVGTWIGSGIILTGVFLVIRGQKQNTRK